MHYSVSNPFVDFFEKLAASGQKAKYEEFWVALLNLSLIAKSSSWGDEEEYRITRAEPGLVYFDSSEIKEISFGIGMSTENRKTIKNIDSGPECKHVEFFEIVSYLYCFDFKKKPLKT